MPPERTQMVSSLDRGQRAGSTEFVDVWSESNAIEGRRSSRWSTSRRGHGELRDIKMYAIKGVEEL